MPTNNAESMLPYHPTLNTSKEEETTTPYQSCDNVYIHTIEKIKDLESSLSTLPPQDPFESNCVEEKDEISPVPSGRAIGGISFAGEGVTHPIAILEHEIMKHNGEIPDEEVPTAVTNVGGGRNMENNLKTENGSVKENNEENKKNDGNNLTKVPQFYFPPSKRVREDLSNIIASFEHNAVKEIYKEKDEPFTLATFIPVTNACNLPRYMNQALFAKIDELGDISGDVTFEQFERGWQQLIASSTDENSLIFNILKSEEGGHLIPDDFNTVLEDVVLSHPGFEFLANNNVFQDRYMETVTSRIFYEYNRNWTNKMTLKEFRQMNFGDMLRKLETKVDISHTHDYFSYKHFYVIYCSFWELDSNHDLQINEKELAIYGRYALSERIVSRIINGWGKVSDLPIVEGSSEEQPQMSYRDFIWFFLSEIDKSTPTAIEYWFRCLDLDGDGVLSTYELDYFFQEQINRMQILQMEPIKFEDCICQMYDMIKPAKEGIITLRDLKRCRQNAPPFFDMFINLTKFIAFDHNQQQWRIRQQILAGQSAESAPEIENMSEFDSFAEIEYNNLVLADQRTSQHLETSEECQQLGEMTTTSAKKQKAADDIYDDELGRKHTKFYEDEDFFSESSSDEEGGGFGFEEGFDEDANEIEDEEERESAQDEENKEDIDDNVENDLFEQEMEQELTKKTLRI
ncbi:8646_t:CDS:10 [Ambispora gerdemannii]|uniref:8646_t:CDS:1 n=1 Tax=Ambispora gerdemannii TaxID=144530 RepID=A0A9N9CW30_9GLOM|nr:8646_t:CDS:10 [Ambispora gerdemannii]